MKKSEKMYEAPESVAFSIRTEGGLCTSLPAVTQQDLMLEWVDD